MINLLPPDIKKSYRFARRNVGLRRWVLGFLLAFVGLGVIATYGLLTLHQSTAHSNAQIATSQQLFKQEKFTQTQTQVQDISNSFKLVVKVLGQEVLFSELLKQIATLLPNNTELTQLSINQTTGGLDITTGAIDYQTASQVYVNMSDPSNKIFTKADIESINCGIKGNAAYPCVIDIRALFAPNNPFLFINSGNSGATK